MPPRKAAAAAPAATAAAPVPEAAPAVETTSRKRGNDTVEKEVAKPTAAAGAKRRRADLVPVPTRPTTAGVVFSTGANVTGELGVDPEDTNERWKPGPVRALDDKNIVFLDVGGMHSAAISANGTLYTWGCNDEKALGRQGDIHKPEPVEGNEKVKFVTAALCDSATFAIDENGILYGCGTFRDVDGVLGFSPEVRFQEQLQPVASLIGHRFTGIAAGSNHLCALTTDGKVLTFGAGRHPTAFLVSLDSNATDRGKAVIETPNPLGRISLARSSARGAGRSREAGLTPIAVYIKSRAHPVAIFSGSFTSFVILSNGQVYGWGLNKDGQLGLGHTDNVDTPTHIAALDGLNVDMIAAGDFHTLCRTSTGKLYAMGMNQYGQVGIGHTARAADGSIAPIDEPTVVPIDGSVQYVACGTQHSIAVTSDGRMFVWGTGSVGQLGLGEDGEDDRFEPTLLPTKNRQVIAADASAQFTIILTTEKSS